MQNQDILRAIENLLKGNPSLNKEFLDVSDAAYFLGVSKSTIYKLNFRKEIPFYKPENGKKVYYKKEDLVNYMSKIRFDSSIELTDRVHKIIKNLSNV